MVNKMKAYKGFDENLKCMDFQYEIGREYTHNGEVKACKGGFHACENPFSTFFFYPPYSSRYCEVEGSGIEDTKGTKTAFEKIKIIKELKLFNLIYAGIQYCSKQITWLKNNIKIKENSIAKSLVQKLQEDFQVQLQ